MFMMLNPPPVIYDEVQRVPGLFRYVKLKYDESDGLVMFIRSEPYALQRRTRNAESGP